MKWQAFYELDSSGKWHRTGGYYSEINHGEYNHNYRCNIRKNSTYKLGEKGWRLFIDLGTCYMDMGNILDTKFRLLKEARMYAKDFITTYDNSIEAIEKVEAYKKDYCRPLFDMNLNYVGDDYLGNLCYNQHKDYFNDNPVEYKGIYYILNLYQDNLCLGELHCYPCVPDYISCEDEALASRLLDKTCEIPSKCYDRFRKYKEEQWKK